MPFLSINDYTVPLAAAQPQKRFVRRRARRGQGITGDHRENRLGGGLRSWGCTTKPIHYSRLFALANLIIGNAHVWDFRNAGLTSSGGAGPVRGYSGVTMRFSGGPFADAHFMRLASAGTISLDAQLSTGKYCVLVKRYDGAAWRRYAFLDDGTKWYEGATTATTFGWFSIASGNIKLDGKNDAGSNAQNDIAEVVRMPWQPHSTMLAAWTGSKTTRWPQMPELEVKGSAQAESSLLAIGELGDAPLVPAKIDNEWSGTHGALGFTLHEQPEPY